jgi:hypothetical protein
MKKAPKRLSYRFIGAEDVIRTRDPHITNVLLYQLSYIGFAGIINLTACSLQAFVYSDGLWF